jgi:circadian clock protein KaiC
MPVSTGSDNLDRLLDGGLPEERTVLVTGGPGTGKSTLAMQFLQDGLAAGEECLFVSTEQRMDELQDSFADFAFDLDHENLTITTLHATPGYTMEGDDQRELTLETLDGGTMLGGDYSAPFESEYVVQHLRQFGPVDRVVLDSVSGLSAIGESQDVFRRTILDVIRLVNDEFEATALFTAEESQPDPVRGDVKTVAASDAVQFNTHGVLRVYRERVDGDYHRFIEVVKMRGVDHDTRVYEVNFSERGIRISPRQRTQSVEFVPDDFLTTGVPGLDDLLGGGIVEGGTMLFEHDGQASSHSVLTNVLSEAVADGKAVTFVPPVELPPRRLEEIISNRVGDMDELMNEDRFFLVDFANIWENTRRNVFKPQEHDDHPTTVFRTIDDRRGDREMFSALNVEAQLPALTNDEIRQLRFWQEENFYLPGDTSIYFFNPATLSDELAAFYRNGAWQILRTWIEETGLQYLTVEKSPAGYLGPLASWSTWTRSPTSIQRPPGAGESTEGGGF